MINDIAHLHSARSGLSFFTGLIIVIGVLEIRDR